MPEFLRPSGDFDYGFTAPQPGQLQEIISSAAATSQDVSTTLQRIVQQCRDRGLTAASEITACVQAEVARLKAAGDEALARVQMGAQTALTGTLAAAGERVASLQRSAGIPSTIEYPSQGGQGLTGTSADINVAQKRRQGMQGQGQGQGQIPPGQGQRQGQRQPPPVGGQQVIIRQGGPVIIQQPGGEQAGEGYFLPFPPGTPGGAMPGFPAGMGGLGVPPFPLPGTTGQPGSIPPFPVPPGSPAAPGGPGQPPQSGPLSGPLPVSGPGTVPDHEGLDSALMERLVDLLAHPVQPGVPPAGGSVGQPGTVPLPPGPVGVPQQPVPNPQAINQLLQQVQQLLTIIRQSPKEGDNYVVNVSSVLDISNQLEESTNTVNIGASGPSGGGDNREDRTVDALDRIAKAAGSGTYDQWFDVARGKLADDRDKIVQYFGESFEGIYAARTREDSILAMSDIVFPPDLDSQLDEYFPDGTGK